MATYKELHGINVQYRASDAPEIEGDVWYNASTGLLKMYASLGAWATGGNRNNQLYDGMGCGTQTAALAGQGTGGTGPLPGNQAHSEEYNGSSWTEGNAVPASSRVVAGGGIQTSAFVAGGFDGTSLYTESHEYDGTNWAEGGNINTGREGLGGAGSASTAGLIVGGWAENPDGATDACETYDGTTWTEVADLTVGKYNASTLGTSTAALCVAGYTGIVATNEEWNGTSWTEIADINTARQSLAGQGSGIGITTLALITGGTTPPPVSALTEEWNGSAWAEAADLSTARSNSSAAGISTKAVISGGNISGVPHTAACEEWDMVASVETVAFD